MAEIAPFRGVYYNRERVGELDCVAAPPYDVLSEAGRREQYARSPFNVTRIMHNLPQEGDDETQNPYTRAAAFLNEWLATGVLLEDSQPALYAYGQDFADPRTGERRTRIGLFCALKLEPYSAGVVVPHEETHTKAKEDRLLLMRATRANPEPIFGLFEDPEGAVSQAMACSEPPLLAAKSNGDEHFVWRIGDPDAIAAIQAFFRDRRVWIADGHHRYETALNYQREQREPDWRNDPPPSQPYDYILIVLTAFEDPGMVVLPTHRLVQNVSRSRMENLRLHLERYFDVFPVNREEIAGRLAQAGPHSFGIVTAAESFIIRLRDPGVMDEAAPEHCPAWRRLDVSILQTLVLDRSLRISARIMETTPDVAYTRSLEEALAHAAAAETNVACLLNSPAVTEVRDVAAAGDKMPQKSTFFYPKLWSGLLLRRL